MSSKRSFILLIIGVNINNVREECARKKENKRTRKCTTHSMVSSVKSIIEYAKYEQIPTTFIDANTFVKQTNLLCWHCGLSFNCAPRFVALDFHRFINSAGVESREWIIEGNFCSWACAAAYIDVTYSDSKKWALQQNLALIRSQIDSVPVLPIQCAPARISMRAYCGGIGISQQEFEQTIASYSNISIKPQSPAAPPSAC